MKHKYAIRVFLFIQSFNCFFYACFFQIKYSFEKKLKNECAFLTEFLRDRAFFLLSIQKILIQLFLNSVALWQKMLRNFNQSKKINK